MRITTVISSLSCGGSERVMRDLAAQLSSRGHDVTLITISSTDSDFYVTGPRVDRVALGLASEPRHMLDAGVNNWRRWRMLRRAVRRSRPDLVLSFLAETNILTLAACMRLGIPVVVSERVDPRHSPIGGIRGRLRRRLYPTAAAVVVQTEAVRTWMAGAFLLDTVHVIPNPVEPPAEAPIRIPGLPADGEFVIGMGRLTRQKGFDLLLHAFARCSAEHPEWWLLLLGDGEERANLLRLGQELGVTERLKLLGRQPRPSGILRRGELFVLPSRFEGFPNALLEAMACGLPVIAADCPSGPAEIVRPGLDGVLVPTEDVEALAAVMSRLMADGEERGRLGRSAVEVAERFSMKKIADLWEALLRECVRRRTERKGGPLSRAAAAWPARRSKEQ